MAPAIAWALATTWRSAAAAAAALLSKRASTTLRTQNTWPIHRSRSAARVSASFTDTTAGDALSHAVSAMAATGVPDRERGGEQ